MKFPEPPHARSAPARPAWQTLLAEALTDPAELCRLLELPGLLAEEALPAARGFGLAVPRPFVDRMAKGNPRDPLLRQILPTGEELRAAEGFSEDPLGEAAAFQTPGVLAKYQGRSLIVATRRCGVHCRFCFRRHQPSPLETGEMEAVLEAARAAARNEATREIILSGGDPLLFDDDQLASLLSLLEGCSSLARLRIHTRLPIVLPQRVSPELAAALRSTRLRVLIALHVNHPAEVDRSVADSITALADAGVPLLSQTVLLRGVNDCLETLAELFEKLVDLRVMPYYLHQLDRVAGAAHFEVPEMVGVELINRLRARLPGYAVPRYVRDIPGKPSKQALA